MAEPAKSHPEREVLTINEVARLLDISPTTARELAAKGELPGVLPKLGSQWRCSKAAIEEYLQSYRPITGTGA